MKLSKRIASKIGQAQGSTQEQIAVMAYGLTAIFQMAAILGISLIIGILCGFWQETLILFFSVGFLRRLIGGAHSEGYYVCLVTSILMITLFSYLSRYLLAVYVSSWALALGYGFLYALSFFLVYRLAPVASVHKPIRTEEKRKRLRRRAFLVLTTFVLLTAALVVLEGIFGGFSRFSSALAISVLWQVTMLTKPGHKFIGTIDHMFGVKS